jgi:hypothetical protein
MIDNIIRAATCRVSCGEESGTGHLITKCNVLTARHCVIPAIESGIPIELTFGGPEGDIRLAATILAQSEENDSCILSIPESLVQQPIPLNASLPREGDEWRSFGYPVGKTAIGHRVDGTISHLLQTPKLRMDIDLSVDPSVALKDYHGLSGAAVVTENACRGMIRLKVDGTLGAISLYHLREFLEQNGIEMPQQSIEEVAPAELGGSLADRSAFQKLFEQMIARNRGEYVFLEGAHGIGKTTFCSEFEPDDRTLFCLGTYSLASQDRGPGAIYRAQPEVFFDWLSTSLSTLITGKTSRKEERSYVILIRETSALLEAFSKYCVSTQRHGILFLDGLNEAQVADPGAMVKLVGLLPKSLPQSLTVVLTAPNFHSAAVSLDGRVKSQNVISLPPLSDEASLAYCWQELAKEKATPTLVACICEKAQGHPLYLRYLIEYANGSAEGDVLDYFPTLSGPIEEYYEALWGRLLEDPNAINLLAIMARLRWGIRTDDLQKVLTPGEQAVFIPTLTKIRHLLLHPDTTTIYHPSFSEFLVSKTASLEAVVQKRLAEFCTKETDLEYCVLNVIFHSLRSDDAHRSKAFITCCQDWVDTCVELGVEPDTLLFDIEATVRTATSFGPADEVIRLLLLSQRVSFRYNTLFAQSALLIAEALIELRRPREALKHAIRYKNLIVDPDEALQIAFRLIKHQYKKEALNLLKLLHQRILEAYSHCFEKFDLEGFLNLSRLRVKTLLFMRHADGPVGIRQIIAALDHAVRVFEAALKEAPPEVFEECFARVQSVGTSYFLCFCDEYTTLAQLQRAEVPAVPQNFLLSTIAALLECEESLEKYNLPNDITLLPQVFADIEEVVTGGANIEKHFLPAIVDILICLGAPSSIVHLLADKGDKLTPKPIKIKADNGVDVDFRNIHLGASEWRITAFLDSHFDCPIVGAFHETGWFSTLDQLIRALFWCEGKARRAKADGNESLQLQSLEFLKTRVLQPLAFTLAQRVKWQDSYAIPENVFPLIYERVTLVMMDCYPNELPAFLQDLSKRAVDQCGLYTEGFRDVMFAVFHKLTIREIDASLFDEAFRLLQHLKDHVIRGVENRHELVPELLKLIPLYVKLGATEEAEVLYRHMLGVSMGPTWYKEDQLGMMVSVLRKMPPSDNVQTALPLIAGYLERASGEMTFQRFVRYEKQSLLAELFRHGRFVSGCRYFKRQICGTTVELLSDCQQGFIDKPSPMVGMRHPGGALDEQEAILRMVQNADGLDRRLLWALLEIFQCGDERHLDNYATEYAKLINQAGTDTAAISEMVRRAEFVVGAEIEPEEQSRFLSSFRRKLDTAHHEAFSKIAPQVSDADSLSKVSAPVADAAKSATFSEDVEHDDDDRLYMPGTFGRQSSSREADAELAIAETHLQLGNLKAAKNQAAKVLSILQDGGWSIWGNLSGSSNRAEAILREDAASAVEVIRFYAPLLEAERHEQKWRLAEHLIEKVADLLQEDKRSQLLQYVIDHVALMVGGASNEITMFSFLSEAPSNNGSVELFRLILWLLDHPQSLRREKAAGMVAWLVETEQVYFEEGVKEAFSMMTGYSADILCGIFDNMSARQSLHLWERIFALLDMETILRDCRHAGRLIVLLRLAERAGIAGSISGSEVASRLLEHFRSGSIELGSDTLFGLPSWASCISKEWEKLNNFGVTSKELINRIEQNLAFLCSPLDVQSCQDLENAVSVSFREAQTRRFNRWEARVRFALNTAILPYISKQNFREIELALRIFNPSLPERTLTPGFASPADAVINALSTGKDYSGAIGDSDTYFLNYHEITKRGEDGNWVHIEVLAVIVPTSYARRQYFPPPVPTSFSSRQLQNLQSVTTSHETCCHLKPHFAFFGSFTPAYPLAAFKELINAKESDFHRINWRNGRSSDMRYFGRPVQEGCLLSVKRAAVRLPEGKRLAWILRQDGEILAMVDSQNNILV